MLVGKPPLNNQISVSEVKKIMPMAWQFITDRGTQERGTVEQKQDTSQTDLFTKGKHEHYPQ